MDYFLEISPQPKNLKREKMLICLLKASLVARKQLLPHLYHVVLFLGEVAHYLMNCLVKNFSQRCLICDQSNCLHMAILKWQ